MRKMIRVKYLSSVCWACSECGWTFSPSGSPEGASIDEMKVNFERLRDQEFASHDCARHPQVPNAKNRKS